MTAGISLTSAMGGPILGPPFAILCGSDTDKEGNNSVRTMPILAMKAMRLTVDALLSLIERWEDRHADPDNPIEWRMSELTAGLWQASQSLKALIEGDYPPQMRPSRLNDLPEAGALGEAYARELLGDAPIPLRAVD